MNGPRFDTLVRALSDGAMTRRTLARGLVHEGRGLHPVPRGARGLEHVQRARRGAGNLLRRSRRLHRTADERRPTDLRKAREERATNDERFDAVVRALTEVATTRRGLGRMVAGGALGAGLSPLGHGEADAKKRTKRRKKRNKRRGGNGGERDRCRFDRCDGRCVDLDTDANNCGACGDACIDDLPCVGGRCAVVLGGPGSGEEQLFAGPAGIAVDGLGLAFVVEVDRDRVAVIDDEAVVDTIGGPGAADGQFLLPTGVAADRGADIIVTDLDRHRIQRFSADGRFRFAEGGFGQQLGRYNSPHAVALVNRTDQVFVADTGNDSIQELLSNLAAKKRIGRKGNGDGEFFGPKGIAVDRDENLVVADTGNHRVQVIDQDGNKVREFGRPGNGPASSTPRSASRSTAETRTSSSSIRATTAFSNSRRTAGSSGRSAGKGAASASSMRRSGSPSTSSASSMSPTGATTGCSSFSRRGWRRRGSASDLGAACHGRDVEMVEEGHESDTVRWDRSRGWGGARSCEA